MWQFILTHQNKIPQKKQNRITHQNNTALNKLTQ
jgi:hypothetical protein